MHIFIIFNTESCETITTILQSEFIVTISLWNIGLSNLEQNMKNIVLSASEDF